MSTWPRVPYWGGYWNWGRPLIPLPSYIVLTDRATGALLYLGQTGSVGSLSVLLVPWDGTIRQPATVFGPQDGPYLNGHARLYSQNGTLAVEDTSPPAGIYDHRVFTRDGAFGRHLLEITLTEPLTLTYTEINT
jgi:hypothetical protein